MKWKVGVVMAYEFDSSSASGITFIRIRKTDAHVMALYELLKMRMSSHNISNLNLPTYEEHRSFVFSNPYRAWYLIQHNKNYVGSFYLLKNNSIGIFLKPQNLNFFKNVVDFLIAHYKPLPLIKSVRAPFFSINTSPKNKDLIRIIEDSGGKLAQKTYVI